MDAIGDQITEEAAEWVLRLEEDPTMRRHAELTAWLARSPRHIDEFLMVEASFRTVEHFYPRSQTVSECCASTDFKEVVPLRREHRMTANASTKPVSASLGRRLHVLLATASVLLVTMLPQFIPNQLNRPNYVTTTGEQRSFKLPDGSLLNLNTQSRVDVDFSDSARHIRLVRGEALFTVKRDATRPFSVSTDTAIVRAIGTSFNVYRRSDRSTFVSVVEGKVNVLAKKSDATSATSANAIVLLAAGEEASVSEQRQIARNAAADVPRTLFWRQRRLIFRATRLEDVVAEFNRYNSDLQLHALGSEVAERNITGTFDADEPQAFLRFLAEDPSIQLESRPGDVEIRMKSPPKALSKQESAEPQPFEANPRAGDARR